ncbi:MAG: 1-deoxy-D-xylulose-5-phosphate reductoisomerase [archaeon]
MKEITILGSTGSIGTQALSVIRAMPGRFRVSALSSNRNTDLLRRQIKQFSPDAVAVMDPGKADELASQTDIPVYSGIDGLRKIALTGDTVLNSLVGSVGILPTLDAIRSGRDIALANKETLVSAGEIVMKEAKRNNAAILPIDSEHSAILQCLNGEDRNSLRRIILTCSGGPFRKLSKDEIARVTLKDALAHPTWNMGGKITVDSATLMNKGFEVIEARWLYGIGYDRISVVVHPQSIVHSMVEFCDGSTMAQMGVPSMKIPIQYALTYPQRYESPELPRLELRGSLEFEEPDAERFPCLSYAYRAGRTGGTMPAVMNAANEVAVASFLSEKISFTDIASAIKSVMDRHRAVRKPGLEEIMEADRKARNETRRLLEK